MNIGWPNSVCKQVVREGSVVLNPVRFRIKNYCAGEGHLELSSYSNKPPIEETDPSPCRSEGYTSDRAKVKKQQNPWS